MRLRPASAVRLAAASIGAPARASQPGHARIAASGRPAGGRAASIRALLASARGRACARLERALRFRIAVVCVPDGYARSTVVREFLHQRGGAYRRIEIDPSDDGLLGFLRALAAAVGDAVPALSSSFVSIYDRLADAPDAAEQFAGWAGQYLTSIEATIVVDGLAGSTDERVAALLAALIDRTPDTLRWLVVAASGERLPIPRWLAEGQMDLPIDAADFALTAADLLRTSAPAAERFRPERLQQLCALTEGWPAAIALGMAAWNAIDLAAVPRERPALYAYLAAAAVSTLTPRARTFIDATCLFRNFDAALLECAGVFEADESSYTYEPLFRDFSIARLRGRSDGAFQRVAAASATAYERDGRFAQAIAVHLELGERDAASVLLGAHGFALMECGESNVVARALREIPHDVLLAHPRALAVKASFESLHGKFDIAEAWFRHALDRITDGVPRCDIVYRFATDLVRRERSDAIELLEPVVSAMNQEAPLAAPLWALLATAYATNRRLADAARAIERALRIVSQVKDRGTGEDRVSGGLRRLCAARYRDGQDAVAAGPPGSVGGL
jgi:ATP/maltotriose-dependent transcriptional regulator MalT